MAAFRRMGKTELFTHFAERFGIGWNILVQPGGSGHRSQSGTHPHRRHRPRSKSRLSGSECSDVLLGVPDLTACLPKLAGDENVAQAFSRRVLRPQDEQSANTASAATAPLEHRRGPTDATARTWRGATTATRRGRTDEPPARCGAARRCPHRRGASRLNAPPAQGPGTAPNRHAFNPTARANAAHNVRDRGIARIGARVSDVAGRWSPSSQRNRIQARGPAGRVSLPGTKSRPRPRCARSVAGASLPRRDPGGAPSSRLLPLRSGSGVCAFRPVSGMRVRALSDRWRPFSGLSSGLASASSPGRTPSAASQALFRRRRCRGRRWLWSGFVRRLVERSGRDACCAVRVGSLPCRRVRAGLFPRSSRPSFRGLPGRRVVRSFKVESCGLRPPRSGSKTCTERPLPQKWVYRPDPAARTLEALPVFSGLGRPSPSHPVAGFPATVCRAFGGLGLLGRCSCAIRSRAHRRVSDIELRNPGFGVDERPRESAVPVRLVFGKPSRRRAPRRTPRASDLAAVSLKAAWLATRSALALGGPLGCRPGWPAALRCHRRGDRSRVRVRERGTVVGRSGWLAGCFPFGPSPAGRRPAPVRGLRCRLEPSFSPRPSSSVDRDASASGPDLRVLVGEDVFVGAELLAQDPALYCNSLGAGLLLRCAFHRAQHVGAGFGVLVC